MCTYLVRLPVRLFSFLYLMLLGHPLRATLFPYTTLFRSEPSGSGLIRGRRHIMLDDSDIHASRQDRKSTRLNSSHPSISYAVFCLKKKKGFTRWPLFCWSRSLYS